MDFFFGTTWYMAFRPKLHGYELNVEGVNKQASKNRCQVTGNRDGIHHGTRRKAQGGCGRGARAESPMGDVSLYAVWGGGDSQGKAL